MSSKEKGEISRRDFARVAAISAGAALAACTTKPEEPTPTTTPTPFRPATLTDTPEATDTPTATSTPEPTSTPEAITILEKYLYPSLAGATEGRRLRKEREDSEYSKRIDKELNESRINFMILGRRGLLTDSIQVISLDVGENEAKAITMHRDTYAPEVDQFQGEKAGYRINQAFLFGGVPLTEKVMESATGLSADYMFVVDMYTLPDMVSTLFGNRLEVELPWAIPTAGYYYRAGKQTLTGQDVLRVSRARYYGSNADRNLIQQEVIKGMLSKAKSEMSESPLSAARFLTNSIVFMETQRVKGRIDTNFNLSLLLDIGKQLARVMSQEGIDTSIDSFGFPEFETGFHLSAESVSDPRFDRYLLKPRGGDVDSDDAINKYWSYYREGVSASLD